MVCVCVCVCGKISLLWSYAERKVDNQNFSLHIHTNKTNSFVCMHAILSLKMIIIIIIAEKKKTLVNSEIANRKKNANVVLINIFRFYDRMQIEIEINLLPKKLRNHITQIRNVYAAAD